MARAIDPDDIVVLRTDPDFRREPRTSVFCALCQRDLTGEHAWGFLTFEGFAIVHPGWAPKFQTDVGGEWQRIGPECAKKFPPTWTLPEKP